MKKIILFLTVMILIFSCSEKEEIVFESNPKEVDIKFIPTEGGAIMEYKLPKDGRIYGIKIKYNDFKGKEINKIGTYLSNSLLIKEFAEAKKDIPVEIYLMNKAGNLSKVRNMTFSTLSSSGYQIFESMQVSSFWDGFTVKYKTIENTDGFINISYVCKSPTTNIIDTLLVSSQPIIYGQNSFYYSEIKDVNIDKVTVVVSTEDKRGNKIGQKVYENVSVSRAEFLDPSNFEMYGAIQENEFNNVGYKYAFDGDKTGITAFEKGRSLGYRFISEPNCVGNKEEPERSVFTIDLQKENIIAYVSFYSHLSAMVTPLGFGVPSPLRGAVSYFDYPSHVEIYGTNKKDLPLNECDKLGEYKEPNMLYIDEEEGKNDFARGSWIFAAVDKETQYQIEDFELFKQKSENYIKINCEDENKKYRYIKINIKENFYTYSKDNDMRFYGDGKFGVEEIEIYTKKQKNDGK